MRAITGLLFIIFSGNMMTDCASENMLTDTYEYLGIAEFETNNRFIERTGDNSITWKADADNKINIFLGFGEGQGIFGLANLCEETELGPKVDKYRDDLVTFFLAQGKPCPIMKDTTSNLENQVYKVEREQSDYLKCGSYTTELILSDFSDIMNLQLIISVSLNITTTGCQ